MRFTYITDISVSGNSGKEKATREKFIGLRAISFFHEIPVSRPQSKNFISTIIFDIRVAFYIFNLKGNIVIISRTKFGIFTYLVSRFKRYPYIMDKHADNLEENRILNKGIKRFFIHVYYQVVNSIISKMDGYILNHENLVKTIEKSKPFLVSYNGVSSNIIRLNSNALIISRNRKRKIILFIGSCSVWHGVDDFINSWQSADTYKWDFYIVGSVDTKVRNNIFCLGKVYGNELYEIIQKVDAFVLPVKDIRVSPGSPLKLYEYLAYRKPILTVNLPGYGSEILKYNAGVVGNIFNPKELNSLLANLNDGIEKRDFYNSLDFLSEITWESRMTQWANWVSSNFSNIKN